MAATEELSVEVPVDAANDAASEGLALNVITATELATPVLVGAWSASLWNSGWGLKAAVAPGC